MIGVSLHVVSNQTSNWHGRTRDSERAIVMWIEWRDGFSLSVFFLFSGVWDSGVKNGIVSP